jgi:endoglycosylceramidase
MTLSRRRRSLLLLVVLALVGAGCSGGGSDAGGDEAVDPSDAPDEAGCDGTVESPDTRFIVDACGRVVILRGVNVESSAKGSAQDDPHLPATPMAAQAQLQQWGWNSVRFLVFWGAMEPEDGTWDDGYLDQVAEWLDWYADHDVHVVLDLHQDLYSWKTNGNGAPDWAVDTKGLEVQGIAEGVPWYAQGADPAVQAAYQSFWNPEDGARDFKVDYLEAVAHLAERFADHPAVIGYDVMNEPSFANGDLDATLAIQAEAAAGEFQNENLTEFMQGGIDAVRTADQDAWVMVQPTSLLNAFPYPGDLLFEDLTDPREGPPRLTYAGHLYQPEVHDGGGYAEGDEYLATWQEYRAAEAERFDASLWFGEWGGAPDQPRMDEYVDETTTMADELMAGWAWWSWDPGGWGPMETDLETRTANGDRLLRVQPRAVAGTPTSFEWDAEDLRFTMAWDERVDATGATEVAVPSALFPDGFVVVLDGELIEADWDETTSVLAIDPDRSASDHTVCIAGADDDQACDTA